LHSATGHGTTYSVTEIETLQRWEKYRRANTDRPEARERELRHLFSLLNPAKNERIWEAGTGNGYLTFPLAEAVGPEGKVLTTDVTEGNIEYVRSVNAERGLPIEAILIADGLPALEGAAGSVDAVASIATLHHYDNRRAGTGERGRRAALGAFYEAVRPGGRLVVSDILHGTNTQKYFDAIDDPRLCAPHGHPHDFFTRDALADAADAAGFKNIVITVEFVPWQFTSLEEARTFVHTIHNAQCTPEESFALAQKILGFKNKKTHHELGWELFYLTAKKG